MASRLQDAIQRGLRADQPLATAVSAGTLYYVTDELVTERSSGSAWQTYSDAGAVPTAITQLTGDVTAGPGPGSVAATIAADAVTNAKLANMADQTIKGNDSGGAQNPQDLSANEVSVVLDGATDPFVRTSDLPAAGITALTGDVTATGPGSVAATIANDAVTDAKLRESGALSVIGRSANSTGNPADISATPAGGAVLRESGSVLGFGTVATAGLANAAVTYAKIQNVTDARLLGNFTGGAAAPAEYSLGAGLEHSAGAIRTKVDIRTELHGVTVDGGGALVTTGSKGWFRFPVAGTITAWNLMADAAGNLDFDVSQDATYPATTSVLTPSLSGVAQNSATGLTIPVTAGDYFDFAITGTPTVITKAVLQLTFVVTG